MNARVSARRRRAVGRAFCSGAIAALALPAAAQAATVGVTTEGADSATCGVGANPPCATIAQAVANAGADDTVEVGPGTFSGEAQLVIDKNLTLRGSGAGQTTFEPGFDTSSTGAWIQVTAGNTFDLSRIALDGDGNDVAFGVRYVGSAGGEIDEVDFRNIAWDHPYLGIAVSTNKGGSPDPASGSIDITESTFEDIRRVGVLYKGSDVTGTFAGNTYEGKGDGDFLDYALDISAGADVDVSGNTVSGNRGVASTDGSTSAAFLVTTFWGPGTEATFTDNDLTDNTVGIHVGFNGSDASAVTAAGNRLVGNDDGIRSTNPAVDAENNWWGCNGGPGAAGCDTVDGSVDADPRLVLGLSANPTSIATGGASSQLTAEIGANSAGQPVGSDVFDGEDVVFATDRGTIQTPRTFAGTTATGTLTSGASAGTATVSGTYDNQTSQAQVTFVAPEPETPPEPEPEPPLPAPLPGPSTGADEIVGTDADDVIVGLAGDDTILGGLGDDLVKGGQGVDSVSGGEGDDEVGGGRGADAVGGGEGNDVLRGGPGRDVLDGGPGRDDVAGNRGQDEIVADDGDKDTINCGANVDTVVADDKDDVSSNCENVI